MHYLSHFAPTLQLRSIGRLRSFIPAIMACGLLAMFMTACATTTAAPASDVSAKNANRWSPSLADKPTTADAKFWLVKDGKPSAVIVIAAKPLDTNQQAAQLLQDTIRKISGATLKIVDDSKPVTGPAIYIGASGPVEALKLNIPSGFSTDLNNQGYLIKTIGDKLVLAGNDHQPKPAYKGSLFATTELLGRLGCRWYFPGDFGEVYPTSQDVAVGELNIHEAPDMPVRGFWYGMARPLRRNKTLKSEMNTWQALNRYLPYGSVIPSAGDGSIMRPFRQYKRIKKDGKKVRVNQMFLDHPEYFALKKDGTHNAGYLCVSTPAVLDVMLKAVDAYFAKNPDALAYPIAPPDGAPTCECPDCQAKNEYFMQKIPSNPSIQDISGSFYWFLNEVAKRVKVTHPGKWIATTAYAGRIRPPENITLSDNIVIHTALLAHSRYHRYDSPTWHTTERVTLYKRWTAMSRNIVEREYYPVFQFHLNLPTPMYRATAYNMRLIHKLGMRGAEWEGRTSFMGEGANDYIRAQLLWNVNTDMDALLDDYYTRFYGNAGPAARKFDAAIEDALTNSLVDHHEEERIHEIYPHNFVVKVTDAAKASRPETLVASASPATQAHVKYFLDVVDHFRAYSDMRHAQTQLDFVKAASKAQKMIDIEDRVNKISLTFIDSFNNYFDTLARYGQLGANASPHGKLKQYKTQQSFIDGTQGTLVATTPITWRFKTDPNNEGLYAQWYLNDGKGSDWRDMDTTSSWEIQGLQDKHARGYNGFAWYTTSVDIPAVSGDKPPYTLYLAGVNNQAWVWINGKLAGATPHHEYWIRWKYQSQLDISQYVKPGQRNHISIRVWNDQDAGGLFRRSYIYSPVAGKATTDKAAAK